MKEKVKRIISRLHPRHVTALFETFLRDESISGKLILAAALSSLIVVNSPLNESYAEFWHTSLSIGLGNWSMSLDLRHWVNEGLMAFFFLVVGLEIKRELVKGELREFKTAILPIGAAIGGMIIPALIYLLFNAQTEASSGWGIPIATDIAFAVAILTLLGRRVPVALKVFLLTLAIADDIGAIIVIALFYAEIIHYGYLFASIAIVLLVFLFRKQLIDQFVLIVGIGILLWVTTHSSGIHASIVGAVMGLLAPIATKKHTLSVAERVEKLLLPFTTFIVLPVFAFANAGFIITGQSFSSNQSVLLGIILGLVVGKTVGVVSASWLLTRAGIASLPDGVSWRHIIGVGFLAGIGFTVSIFITELAFAGNNQLIDSAKLGIFVASFISGLLGIMVLSRPHKEQRAVQ